MSYKILSTKQHLKASGGPKRILSLDGGGLRGVISLAFLKDIETILKSKHSNSDEFRLSHYFDLIAGTSTGAIIAAALALDWKVDDIIDKYFELGHAVFKKSLLRHGYLRAKYDEKKLIKELKKVYGSDTTLGSSLVKTGLLIITKRLDTGSPWPISNNPFGQFYNHNSDGVIGNKEYPLWQVVRASTAAPRYFEPQNILIKRMEGHKSIQGEFVDGGVSPFNNPALQSLMYVTLDGYKINWPMGEDKILLVSIGTGTGDLSVQNSVLAAKHGVKSLLSLMEDCSVLQNTILQWLSSSPTAKTIDLELGDLAKNLVGQSAGLSYLRYDLDLSIDYVKSLDSNIKDLKKIKSLTSLDAPENMELLFHLGQLASSKDIKASHFPLNFNLN